MGSPRKKAKVHRQLILAGDTLDDTFQAGVIAGGFTHIRHTDFVFGLLDHKNAALLPGITFEARLHMTCFHRSHRIAQG